MSGQRTTQSIDGGLSLQACCLLGPRASMSRYIALHETHWRHAQMHLQLTLDSINGFQLSYLAHAVNRPPAALAPSAYCHPRKLWMTELSLHMPRICPSCTSLIVAVPPCICMPYAGSLHVQVRCGHPDSRPNWGHCSNHPPGCPHACHLAAGLWSSQGRQRPLQRAQKCCLCQGKLASTVSACHVPQPVADHSLLQCIDRTEM